MISKLTEEPSRTGIFLDFDGTLSAIVPRPQNATLVEGAEDVLAALARLFALVAVISGRSLEDLKARVRPKGVLLAGAYGRERSDARVRRQTEGWETISIAATAATRGMEGVTLERKGAGIALHYRAAPDRADDVRAIVEVLSREFGLEIRPGRKVFELIVPGLGKGDAIVGLIEQHGLHRVCVAGDDWGDLEAFTKLRDTGMDALIVAVASDEAPPGLDAHADLMLSGPGELVAMLGQIAAAAG